MEADKDESQIVKIRQREVAAVCLEPVGDLGNTKLFCRNYPR
jgi:hypothetical protein